VLHDQNFSETLEYYQQYGEKANDNSGFLDGSRYTERRNYYHKPVANLNWDFNIKDNMELSTVLYASWGRGGGTGNLGNGPEIINVESGKKLTKFYIATNENYKNQQGDVVKDTLWHQVVAWGKTADIIEKYLVKVSEVAIEGKLKQLEVPKIKKP